MRCAICGKEFDGYGNDPFPVRENGKCCNLCNTVYVVQSRIAMMRIGDNKELREKFIAMLIASDEEHVRQLLGLVGF